MSPLLPLVNRGFSGILEGSFKGTKYSTEELSGTFFAAHIPNEQQKREFVCFVDAYIQKQT